MTSVGKLLVIINLVMSMFFMGFAVMVYTAREDVKAKIDKQAESLAAAKKAEQEAKTLQATAEADLENEKTERSQEQQVNQDTVDRLTQQNQTLEAQLKQAKEDIAKATAALESATTEQGQRKVQTDELIAVRDQLLKEKTELVTVKTNLQDELSQTKNDLEILTARAAEMEQTLQQYQSWIVRNNKGVMPTQAQLEDRGDMSPPPDVEGRVTEVDETGRFIQLSIGADDGLQNGHELNVWRTTPEPKYVGKIRIFDVRPTTAVAQPLYTTGRGLIRPNDHVGPHVR
jgi:hypothetical protein